MYKLMLREIRKSRGITQEQLAHMISVSTRVVGAWEREETEIPLDMAFSVASALNCTIDELAGSKPAENEPGSVVLSPKQAKLLREMLGQDS